MDNEYIYGRNSVLEYLNTEHSINKAFISNTAQTGSINIILAKLKDRKIPYTFVEKNKLTNMVSNDNHQGIVLSVPPFDYADIDDLFESASKKNEDVFIIILDGIEDPHNVGAIIRTANAVGVDGIIIKKRRAADINATVNKISAGALNYTPIVRVSNLNDTIRRLKERGVWIVSADMSAQTMYDADLTGPIALVIGNEGSGISNIVKKNSDYVVSIPMYGNINSLNASVSSAILSYEIKRQRLFRR